jgi:dihydroorotate dehydrogenase
VSGLYGATVRRALFRLGGGDAETAHERTLAGLARLGRHPGGVALARRLSGANDPRLARTVFGVRVPGPVGLAAGMDKDGAALAAWPALGLGFVEVGTVTAHAQPGNPRPRLFRLPASGAVVNRMGFNNAGAAALAAGLADLERPTRIPIGVSLGKSKVTPLEAAVPDYLESFRLVRRYADYVAINVSSPNTPGLRTLQDRGHLDALLGALRAAPGASVPLLLKIAPDLDEHAIAELLEVCAAHGVDGVIVANTTLSRTGVAATDTVLAAEAGGLSGRPLTARTRSLVRFVVAETGGRLPVIGVGGILTADDALALFDEGAALVQVLSGLVYAGPGLVRAVNRRLTAEAGRSGQVSAGAPFAAVRAVTAGSGGPAVSGGTA